MTEQISLLATVVLAFAALAAVVLTGQAGIRQDLRALQIDTLAGQAELRAGQARLRKDLAALGTRLAVVDHRADALETRLAVVDHRADALETRCAVVEQRTVEWPALTDVPGAGSDPSISPAGSPPWPIPAR